VLITKLSGLLKAITYTIRVIFRPGLKLSYIDKLSRCKEGMARVFAYMVQI